MNIQKIIITLVSFSFLTACFNNSERVTKTISHENQIVQFNELNKKDLDEKIQLIFNEKKIPGMSVLVVHDQETILQKSYGVSDLVSQTKMTESSSVRLASATKVLTGLLVMSLAEDGVIELDKPIQNYLADAPASWYGIPLWRILNHTSGIPQFLNSKEFEALSNVDKTNYSHRQAFEFLNKKPLDYQPGSNWRYQQSAYSMLAMILIELTDKSWDELLTEHVFKPANMSSTNYGDSLGKHPVSYILKDEELVVSEYYYPKAFSMGGGYNTTSNDLMKLFKALSADRVVSNDFLFQESMMIERLYDLKSEYYAPATIVKEFGEVLSLGHSGGGGLADIRYFPQQKVGIAVVSNYSGSGVAIELTEHISEMLFGVKVIR